MSKDVIRAFNIPDLSVVMVFTVLLLLNDLIRRFDDEIVKQCYFKYTRLFKKNTEKTQ